MSETRLIAEILARHGARPDLRLFRNFTGGCWVGKLVRHAKAPGTVRLIPGDAVIRGARQVAAGLAVGSADLVGIHVHTFPNPDDLMQTVRVYGRFVSLEVKTENVDVEPHQKVWGRVITELGGLHAIVRSVADVDALLGEP